MSGDMQIWALMRIDDVPGYPAPDRSKIFREHGMPSVVTNAGEDPKVTLVRPMDQETYRIIAEAVHQATGGNYPNNHPAYLWVRENLGPLTPWGKKP